MLRIVVSVVELTGLIGPFGGVGWLREMMSILLMCGSVVCRVEGGICFWAVVRLG